MRARALPLPSCCMRLRMDLEPLGNRRNLTMPGLSATVGEQIEALRCVAGDAAVKRIRREPDPVVAGIVAGWPRAFDARRALKLGFRAESSFEEIIRIHIEDELGGRGRPLERLYLAGIEAEALPARRRRC